jgi:hypothetical protein
MSNVTVPPNVVDKADVEILYDKIRISVDVKKITAADISIIIQKVVQILTTNSELTGVEKRDLVEYVITRLYNEIPESNDQKVAIFQAFIGAGLPTIIHKAYEWVMEKFDLDKDGKISCQECSSVWARCCVCCVQCKYEKNIQRSLTSTGSFANLRLDTLSAPNNAPPSTTSMER